MIACYEIVSTGRPESTLVVKPFLPKLPGRLFQEHGRMRDTFYPDTAMLLLFFQRRLLLPDVQGSHGTLNLLRRT